MKLQKLNLLLIIILFLGKFNFSNASNDGNTAATVVAATAVGAAAGYGFYKLFSSFSTSSDNLVDDACKELMKAKQLSKQLEIIDKEFDGLSNIERKQEIFSVNEELAEQIASTSPKKVIDENYLRELKHNIKNLRYYQDKFPKRIRKLQKFKNTAKYQPVINDMIELVNRINILLPKLELLSQYLNNHIRYFELDEIMNFISNLYANELKMFASKKILAEELKRTARSKYRSSSYPLIDYINGINKDISKMDRYIARASLKYEELVEDAQNLRKKISKIKDFISTDKDYFAEQRALDAARAQDALVGGMFVLGAAASAAVGVSKNEPKKEVILVEKNKNYSYEIETPQEYIIYE